MAEMPFDLAGRVLIMRSYLQGIWLPNWKLREWYYRFYQVKAVNFIKLNIYQSQGYFISTGMCH